MGQISCVWFKRIAEYVYDSFFSLPLIARQ